MTNPKTTPNLLLALLALLLVVVPVSGSLDGCDPADLGSACCCAPVPAPTSCCDTPSDPDEPLDSHPECACEDPGQAPPSTPQHPAPRDVADADFTAAPPMLSALAGQPAGRVSPDAVPRPRESLHVLLCVFLS